LEVKEKSFIFIYIRDFFMDKFTCNLCQREFDSYKGFQNHNSRAHKINGVQTFINVYYNGIHPVCKCGCNEKLNYQNGKFGEYIRGHVARVNGGFYTEEGINKSSDTRRQQYKDCTREQWNKGKQYTDEQMQIYQVAWQSTSRRAKISEKQKENVTRKLGYESWQHWYDTLPERKRYYYDVWKLTEANAHLIPDYDPEKRGLAGQDGAYQIDHIIPISIGYTNKMPPDEIAHPNNLRFIAWQENLIKGSRR
jgi:hypothetical protein